MDLFDLPKQFRCAPDSRKQFLAALQTIEVTRLISDFENSDLEQTVDINEAVSKFVVILESAPKQSLQLGYVKQKKNKRQSQPWFD